MERWLEMGLRVTRQNKYSVGLTIRWWGGVRGDSKVLEFFTKKFLLL